MARPGVGRRARRGGLAVEARLEEDGCRGDADSAVTEAVLQGCHGGAVAGIALASRRHGYGSLGNGKEAEEWRGLWRLGKGEGAGCWGRKKGMAAARASYARGLGQLGVMDGGDLRGPRSLPTRHASSEGEELGVARTQVAANERRRHGSGVTAGVP